MTQYIDKSVVVAEINRVLNSYDPNQITSGRYALASLRDFLETLEVKEVDFESEWKKYFEYRGDVATVNIKHLAKHFFELGIKAQKGEFKKESETNCPNFDEAQGTPITK